VNDRRLVVLAAAGLAVGGVFGLAGTFAPSAALRGLAWGIDGLALVMASALLTLRYYRHNEDMVAAGFLVFAIGEGLIVSGAAMDLAASVPSFGAGAGLWAVALALISVPRGFPHSLCDFSGLAPRSSSPRRQGRSSWGRKYCPRQFHCRSTRILSSWPRSSVGFGRS